MKSQSTRYSIAVASICAFGYPFNLFLQQFWPRDHGVLVGLALAWIIYKAKEKGVKLNTAIIVVGVVIGFMIPFVGG